MDMSFELNNDKIKILPNPIGVMDNRYILEKVIGRGGFSL